MNLESLKTFRDPLFLKQITGSELLFVSTVHTSSSSELKFTHPRTRVGVCTQLESGRIRLF